MNEFTFCPQCSSKNVATVGARWTCPDCGYVLYNNIAAAVGLLITAQNRLLIFTRTKDPGKDKYGVPGGFADAGESLEAACRRECMEEIGIEPPAFTYLCSGANVYPYKGVTYRTCDAFFHAEYGGTAEQLLAAVQTVDGEAANCIMPPLCGIRLSDFAFDSTRNAVLLLQQKLGLA